jgi:hypothetical protein
MQPSGNEGTAVVCASQRQPGITCRELAALLGFSAQDFLAMLYSVYIDDSADEKQQILMVAGALIGTIKQWGEVRSQWKRRLKRDGLDYFKSSEYSTLHGQFAVFRDPVKYPKPKGSEAARTLRSDLEKILKRHSIIGVATVLPLAVYRDVINRVGVADRLNPDPFSFTMQCSMRECALLVKDWPTKKDKLHQLAFICDDSPNSPMLAQAYAGFKHKNLSIQDMLQGFSHLDDKKWPPLQAADMTASLGRELGLEHLKTGDKVSLSRLHGVFHKLVIWDRPSLLRLARLQ